MTPSIPCYFADTPLGRPRTQGRFLLHGGPRQVRRLGIARLSRPVGSPEVLCCAREALTVAIEAPGQDRQALTPQHGRDLGPGTNETALACECRGGSTTVGMRDHIPPEDLANSPYARASHSARSHKVSQDFGCALIRRFDVEEPPTVSGPWAVHAEHDRTTPAAWALPSSRG